MSDKDNVPVCTGPKGIDIEDILHYRAKGLSTTEIGKLTGCTHSNVVQRLQDAELESTENFATYKDKVFEHTQRKLVNKLTGEKLNAMSGLQLITGMAILQDKIQAIRGQATEIIEHRNITIDLSKAYEAMRASQGNTVDISVDNLDNG